ncbi:hypothetical protein P7C70_g1973, partial [Phenoliferia sp. Uapishka_3]
MEPSLGGSGRMPYNEMFAYGAGNSAEMMASGPSPRSSVDDVYGRGLMRPRRSSTSSSFAESIASSHASSSHSSMHKSSSSMRAPSMSEVSLSPRLHPGGSEGFLVDVPGAGTIEVPWSELVGLLANSGAVDNLSDKHIVKKTAFYMRSIINTAQPVPPPADANQPFLPSNDQRWDQVDTSVNQVATEFSTMHPFAPQPPSIIRRQSDNPHYASTAPVNTNASPLPGEIHGSVSSSTLRGESRRRDKAEYRTPLERAFVSSISPPKSSSTHYGNGASIPISRYNTPMVESPFDASANAGPYSSVAFVAGGAIAHLPPAAQAENQAFVERHSRPHPGLAPSHSRQSHVQRDHQRRASQPYSRPASLHSASSSVSSSSAYESESEKPRQPRALNSKEEHYMWNNSSAQLFRIAPGTDVDPEKGEVITFPPGTYYKVFKDELEVLPSDGRLINDWLRSQHCVGDCRFRFEKKRPATIRAHFVGCKARQKLQRDPIKRLCELQTQAQRRFKINSTHVELPRPGSSAGWADHYSETSSISEADEVDGSESIHSHSSYGQYYDQPSSYGSFEKYPGSEESGYEVMPTEHFQPIHALAVPMEQEASTSDFANALVSSSTGSNAPGYPAEATDWNHPWLSQYGLPDPSNGHTSALPDEPNVPTGSFLSMHDED